MTAMKKALSPPRGRRRKGLRIAAMFGFSVSDQVVRIYHGVRQHAIQAGWLLEHSPFAARQLAAGERFDGVVGYLDPEVMEQVRRAGIPAVNVWQDSQAADMAPGVFVDTFQVGRLLARHLLARGVVRFGHILWEDRPLRVLLREGFVEELKIDGLQDALSVCNLPPAMYDTVETWTAGIRQMDEWIESLRTPVGVFSHNLSLLHILAERCQDRHGLNVPRDVALICGGMQVLGQEHPALKITSVALDFERVGLEAAGLLEKMIAGAKPPAEDILVEPGKVIVRETTDVTAADDPLVAAAMRFMAEQCHRPIHVTDVADAVSVGRRTLEKRFRAVLSRTVANQIEYMRVERAKRLLVESREPTKTIARRCGYRSGQQLYLAFLRREGVTPRQFRKQNARQR